MTANADKVAAGAIRLEEVCLDYPIYERLVWDRLREIVSPLIPAFRPPAKRVLDSISLAVEPGELVGLLGCNGAGKTTLLKLVSGLIPPDTGQVSVGGRVMALLAMGTGFRANFTGRENIYYGGLLLGLPRAQMDGLIDAIAAFADLGPALDQPYFTYSSGMRARLGFALATSVPADVVILDETLATGDSRFVARCYRRIQEICDLGRTILFVSHNLGEVARMTRRVVVLEGGRVVFDGPTAEGITRYEQLQQRRDDQPTRENLAGVEVDLALLTNNGERPSLLEIGSPVKLRLTISSEQDLGPCFVYLRVADVETDRLVTYLMKERFTSLQEQFEEVDNNVPVPAGLTEIVWHLPNWLAGEGRYLFDVYIGPPVDCRNPDISRGRLWRRQLVQNAVYANPFLKGAAAVLEMPVTAVDIRHAGVGDK